MILDATSLPPECLFPRTAKALLCQAKAFTGIEIVADPHWRATSSLWETANNQSYRAWLNGLQNEQGRFCAAFVFLRSNLGAYIVYADHGRRWNGSLSSLLPDDIEKASAITHELSHLAVSVEDRKLSDDECHFFDEQCAILGSSMINAAVGNKSKSDRLFPCIKQYQPAYFQEEMIFDNFCIYTPSPMCLFYETPAGRAHGKTRFLSPSGIVRFDRAADDIVKYSSHLRHHLSALFLFSGIAEKLISDPSLREKAVDSVPSLQGTQHNLDLMSPDAAASTILKSWWYAVQESLGWKGPDAVRNIYVGEPAYFPSIHHAESYFLTLASTAHYALQKRPDDPLLPSIYGGLNNLLSNPARIPKIKPTVVARCDEGEPEKERTAPRSPFGSLLGRFGLA